jgi:hypothetical protein
MRRRAHRPHRSGRTKAKVWLAALVAIALGLGFAGRPASALDADEDQQEIHDEQTLPSYAGTHDPNAAAHPLRIVAYALHPVGVALDWIVVRPAVWVVRHEPFRTIFGFED